MKYDTSNLGKLKPAPIFKEMSDNLKDPKVYEKIERKILKIMKTDHTHATMASYTKCKDCKVKYEKRRDAIKDFGFKNYAQYLQWKKIMNIIVSQKSFRVR